MIVSWAVIEISILLLQGYEGESRAYVATQGPLPHSIVDFWHMVWFEKTPVIVMITKLKEKNKVSVLTHKAPPIICSRRQFKILPLFQK